ncbi:lipopolysaccharide assembly protein LapB [Chitinivorax sp. B]|uniref:lipopolysaccharide assembly protein LapB n=1 Tax=Chitinivorax sp. B TaxID=2502235 RepID=UPI0032D58962
MELWWLILPPLFFGLGWLAARIDIRQLLRETRKLPLAYYKGLNFLLNDEQDKAIAEFVEIIKSDPHSVDLNFALGSMFRRKGEHERAILIHQNLLARNDINPEHRLKGQYELALDFVKAGLFDRAEEMLQKLTGSSYARVASQQLLDIYQLEKNWEKAIETANRLADGTASFQNEVAEFHCEMAQRDIANSQPEQAKTNLNKALQIHRKCVRANILLGDIALAEGDFETAIDYWKRIETQEPQYLSLVGTRLMDAYKQANRAAEGLQLLRTYLGSYPALDILDQVFQVISEQEGLDAAKEFLYAELRRNASMLGLKSLVDVELNYVAAERRPDLEAIRSLLHDNTKKLAMYQCQQCGFRARQYYWHCPGCAGWETYPPKLGGEGSAH